MNALILCNDVLTKLMIMLNSNALLCHFKGASNEEIIQFKDGGRGFDGATSE
jgi:hypothetical protein